VNNQLVKKDTVRENAIKVFDRIAGGEELHSIASDFQLTAYDFTQEFYADPDLLKRWEAARQARGEVFISEAYEAVQKVRSEELSPQAGKVVIDALFKLASKYAPKLYGEETTLVEKETKKSTPVTINIVGAKMDQPRQPVEEADFQVLQVKELPRAKVKSTPKPAQKPVKVPKKK
jgi:uncharacterized membrane-anchored protein YjiN (DUF445 family)